MVLGMCMYESLSELSDPNSPSEAAFSSLDVRSM